MQLCSIRSFRNSSSCHLVAPSPIRDLEPSTGSLQKPENREKKDVKSFTRRQARERHNHSAHVPLAKMSHVAPPFHQGNVVCHGRRGKHRCGWSISSFRHNFLSVSLSVKHVPWCPRKTLSEPPARLSPLGIPQVGPSDYTGPDIELLFFQVGGSEPFRLIQQNLSIYFLPT